MQYLHTGFKIFKSLLQIPVNKPGKLPRA